jgi:outer membrane protein OmpA-like peptidoglycan-associated protein
MGQRDYASLAPAEGSVDCALATFTAPEVPPANTCSPLTQRSWLSRSDRLRRLTPSRRSVLDGDAMKRVISMLAFVGGLTVLGCGGAQQQPTDPTAASESEGPEQTAEEPASEGSPEPEPQTDGSSDAEKNEAPIERKQQEDQEPPNCRESSAKLALSVDRQSINLERGVLEASMDGPICKIAMTITLKGQPKIEYSFSYTKPKRELTWQPVPRDQIEKIEIRISASDGAYQAVAVVPWSARIDHQEVVFDTDKADIRQSEVPALEDSLAKIKQVLQTVENKGLGTITLFIAGHTDTRGSNERNLDLSRRRAQSIAGWFKTRGLCIPIAFDGFGETILRKVTGDEVDAQENRRVDYILAVEAPAVGKGAKPAWKWISKGC